MSRLYPGYYITTDIIRLYKGDEKRLKFPTNDNWKYQIALDVTYVNKRTGRKLHYGKGLGRTAGSLLVVSEQSKKFNYDAMKADALITGYNYAAGDQYNREGTNWAGDDKDKWKDWQAKVHGIFVIIRRKLSEPTGEKVPRAALKAPVLKVKTKPLTQAELEKKYAAPKKYVAAMKRLHKENVAKETRRLKREKQRALKRKK